MNFHLIDGKKTNRLNDGQFLTKENFTKNGFSYINPNDFLIKEYIPLIFHNYPYLKCDLKMQRIII